MSQDSKENVMQDQDDKYASSRSAGVPPAVSRTSRPQFGEVTIRSRGYLPHLEMEDGTYFVTFRLADSLPEHVLQDMLHKKEQALAKAEKSTHGLTRKERKQISAEFTQGIENYLDNGSGSCILRRTEAATIVRDGLLFFEGDRYRSYAWVIMPNHVHCLFKPLGNHTLSKILHSWKSYTAKKINKVTGKTGVVWQGEYYDRLVRDDKEFYRFMEYIADNPLKAGLRDWKWVWECGQDAR